MKRDKTRRHGLSYTSEYRAWQQMRLRCLDPNHAAYASYGGRGITVCARWIDDPQAFLDDMGKKPGPEYELDRKDNDKGYEPGNCRWATRSVNDRNRRSNRWLEFNGERLTLVEWAARYGLRPELISDRIDITGWSVERALTTPPRPKRANGEGRRAKPKQPSQAPAPTAPAGEPTSSGGGVWVEPEGAEVAPC